MKKFRFRLETVRRYCESREREKKREFGEAVAAYEEEKRRLLRLCEEEQQHKDALREELEGNCDPSRIKAFEAYLEHLYHAVREQGLRVEEARRFMEEKRRDLVEATKERKIMDKLYERYRDRYLYELRREEQSFLDEIAGGRYIGSVLRVEEEPG
jgi:flagellar FliJ protein